MINNPYRRTIYIWVIITIASVAMIFIPGLLGVDGMSRGYAISFVSFFGVVVGVIVILVYNGLSNRFDAIVGGLDVLVRWTYSMEFWRMYSDEEFDESITEVKPLFVLTSVMCLIAGFGVFIIDPEPGVYVLGFMVVVIVLMWLAAFLTRRQIYLDNMRRPGEAIIARKGVLLNNRLYYWEYFGSKLENVELRKSEDYSVLVFTTWAPTIHFGQSFSLRVPVPPGEEVKATEIVSAFKPI